MPVRPLVPVGVVAICLALTACSSGTPAATGAAAGSSTQAGASSTPSESAPTQAASTPATTASAASTTTTVAATGHCSTIDQANAASILGFSTKPGISSKVGSVNPSFVKVDDCLFESAASGSLGYTVVKVDAAIAKSMVGSAKSRLAGAGSIAVLFTSGIADSIAFTMHLPHGVDSQITAQAGDRLLSVASTRKDGNTAKSQASAIAAMQVLVAAG